jgi:hypothetical protein
LTKAGGQRLREETEQWKLFATAVSHVLRAVVEEA